MAGLWAALPALACYAVLGSSRLVSLGPESRGIMFALARVKQDLLDDLQAFGLAATIGDQLIFPTLPTAVAAYRNWAEEHPGATGPLTASLVTLDSAIGEAIRLVVTPPGGTWSWDALAMGVILES